MRKPDRRDEERDGKSKKKLKKTHTHKKTDKTVSTKPPVPPQLHAHTKRKLLHTA